MKRLFSSLSVWLVLADMVYGFGLNLSQSMSLQQAAPHQADGLAVTPDIAFSGLQLAANGGMILIIGFGLLVLLQLNRTVLKQQILSIGIFRTLGLLAVMAFTLPALWEWLWTAVSLSQGKPVVNLTNPRYLVVALCQPFIAALCISRLWGWYRLHKTAPVVPENIPPVV
ncbi:hypothetical protein [Neisseria chenwenguii]|uniref:Uncharacterized protein n=1 Tax=Neisseria chenwenguii TaxID=1853278 RepID=A0A220S4W3_9NEIS|nr:hypothetical protein [Neisseria chenwenguii]ASK28482.1 hypothetical protein BG910_06105 [Neisseria chenwenguii]ROV57068.1 hypothetical protein EGS38_02085 [Neisseria chenwenguii]